jgi:rhamnulokinase
MSGELTLAAVDLGASSGRVMTARVGPQRLELREANRFVNRPVRVAGTLYWDVLALYGGVLDGLRSAGREAGRLDGVGIDSWAVDVGLLDSDGVLLGNPVHYRDARHATAVADVHALVPPEELYRVSGLQHLPFNTVFQLAAMRRSARLAAARRALLVPDLLAYWLTGAVGAEVTNASTTAEAVSGCRRSRRGSPTSPAGPGHWWAWSWTPRCSPRPAGQRGSPTSWGWTERSATCAT